MTRPASPDAVFPSFYGNPAAAATLRQMISGGRLPQTLLLHGPLGVGKATLARRFGAMLLGRGEMIERDDLSVPANATVLAEREKWPADKRNDEPLFFAAHPDFVTFPPDGPLRQVTIPQIRLLKEMAPQRPLAGNRRVFLVDEIDRANEQAANSLLKILEEPPPHLVLLLTAQNVYDLLPTIRSRAVAVALTPLPDEDMRRFAASRSLDQLERRLALANGSPGVALKLDLASYDRRREAMLALLEAASGRGAFGAWAKHAESIAASRAEKLEPYLQALYLLLEDVLVLQQGGATLRNPDLRRPLEAIAGHTSFDWVRVGVKRVDEVSDQVRRNIQKAIALDALAVGWRA